MMLLLIHFGPGSHRARDDLEHGRYLFLALNNSAGTQEHELSFAKRQKKNRITGEVRTQGEDSERTCTGS